jgi:hypothetical protein
MYSVQIFKTQNRYTDLFSLNRVDIFFFSRSNAILIGSGEGDLPIKILACRLTYHLNPIWHGILGLKLSLQLTF